MRDVLSSIRKHKLDDLDAWGGRLIVWLAAASAGLVVVLFAHWAELAIGLFQHMQQQVWWLPLLVTPAGGILIAWLTWRWFPTAAGSGIPQTIASLQDVEDTLPKSRFISLKIAASKIILGVGALAAGFSTGREGPSVQVGASVMHAFRHFLPRGFSVQPRHLIMAGGAAGISAAFNTPLAGIVFAIEELGRRFEQRTNGIILTAIVLAGLVSISLQGNYTYFGRLAVGSVSHLIVIPVLVCGLVCGVAGGLFSRILIASTRPLGGRLEKMRAPHPFLWAGFCGLMVALLGIVSDGAAHGSGYLMTDQILEGSAVVSWEYAPIKFAATIFSYLSGVPGGIFAPSLSIGAGIGGDLMPLFAGDFLPTAIYALCMAAFLAAVTQAPLTSFIIVMEMIDGHEMVISLMAVSLVASMVARLFSPPLYATLADAVQPRPAQARTD